MEPGAELPAVVEMQSPSQTRPGNGRLRRKTLLIAVLGGLVLAAPASAHTIDVRRAAAAVRAEAETLGAVDRARCWRPVIDLRQARHRAICVAWWVYTAAGESCTIFYEVRMAGPPSRRLVVIQTYQPWCASMPEAESAQSDRWRHIAGLAARSMSRRRFLPL